MFGVDDTLDPRRFALFGIDNRRLSLALLLAAVISVPVLALLLVAIASVATWTRGFGISLLALLSAVLVVVTCILVSRVATSVAAFLLATRRAREFSAAVAVLLLILISPAVIVLLEVDWARAGGEAATAIADLLAWTPLGAAWAVPGDAARGDGGAALLHLLIALATVGVLWLLWNRLIAWMLVSPPREGRAKSYSGLGWFDRLPDNPGGAIAARSMTYWLRDPRYRVSLIVVPFVPLFLPLPLLLVGVPDSFVALIPVPVFALLLGWYLHNDVAYDNTAVWQHLAAGTRGRADRLGRLFPAVAFGVPMILIGAVVAAYFFGDWAGFAGILGVSFALFFTGLGLSSVMSARFPYPTMRPGDGPFSQPQNSGGAAVAVQLVSFGIILTLSSPTIVLALLGVVDDPEFYGWALLVGAGSGLLFFVIGTVVGARVFSRRGPEILRAALLNA